MKKVYWLLALICMILAGCGGKEETGEPQSEDVPVGDLKEGPGYFVEKVESVQFQEPGEGIAGYSTIYRMLGDQIYMVRVEQKEETGEYSVFVQSYEIESRKKKRYNVVPRVPGKEGSLICSADLTTDLKLSLKMREEGKENAFFLVQMSLEGEILQVEESFPESGYPWNQEMWSNTKVFGLSDGRTVISRYDAERSISRLTWYQEDGKEELLGDLEDTAVLGMTVDREGILYYMGNDDSLVRWNVEQNTREVLFQPHANGIEMATNGYALTVNDEGIIRICALEGEKGMIYSLTDQEIPGEAKIRLCSLKGEVGISYFQTVAASFRQNGGNVRIALELEGKPEYQEDYRNRILAEMTVGKGPDILYVSREDMILLQDKGMLLDISDMISEEVREQLIPGVLELGCTGGELVGLVPEVNFKTVGTSRQTWDQDGWTVEEFIERIEEKEDWEYLFDYWGRAAGGIYFFNYIIPVQLESLSLLDLEQGTCDFNSEKFIHILQFCKKYASREQREGDAFWDSAESARKLVEGESAAEVVNMYGGMTVFSRIMGEYGDECRIVGYPTGKGSGNYVDSYSYCYLVVNAGTKQQEEIRKFFDLLLNIDNQMNTDGCSVRMDVLSSYEVIRNPFPGGEYCLVHYSPNHSEEGAHYIMIKEDDIKPDHTSYLEEFLEFVKSCTPEPYCPPQIQNILWEEGSAYFGSDKSAEETADIIQRRIQLYLDETR